MRHSGRQIDELRKIVINRNFTRHAEGSVLICCGDTHVLCNASVEDRVPPFLRGKGIGWVTTEYGMLPRSTNSRMSREAARGKQGGRTLEIQRLIGRSLRAVVDREALGERTITLDCDVLQADGGTHVANTAEVGRIRIVRPVVIGSHPEGLRRRILVDPQVGID